jgi:hypothetical protein
MVRTGMLAEPASNPVSDTTIPAWGQTQSPTPNRVVITVQGPRFGSGRRLEKAVVGSPSAEVPARSKPIQRSAILGKQDARRLDLT